MTYFVTTSSCYKNDTNATDSNREPESQCNYSLQRKPQVKSLLL